MKKLFFNFILIGFSVLSCSGQSNRIPQITYNDSAYMKIIANNIVDTISVQVSFFSKPQFYGGDVKKTDIVKPGIYYLALGMTIPDLVFLNIGEDFQSYLIPGDTLEINIGYTINDKKEQSVYYKVKGKINEYFQTKKQKFGYYTFIDGDYHGIDRFYKAEISRSEYNEAVDILNYSAEQNNLFLDLNKKSLPKWFVNLEKANIIYGVARKSIWLYYRLKPFDQKSNSIISVEFNNDKAMLSSLYYSFLQDYFYFKIPWENLNIDHTSLVINRMVSQSKLADSLLKGGIKDYYITCQLSKMYFNNQKAEDNKRVDSFINDNYPHLKKEQIEFINVEKKKSIKIIKSELIKGDIAPSFYLRDTNGTQYQLSNFSGKLVYLHFWTTISELSIIEIPILNELYSKLVDKPIEIVNICMDENLDNWQQIIEKENFKGINLICKGKWGNVLKSSYFIHEMSHYTLIDKNGIIIQNNCKGPIDIYNELLQLFDKE